MNADNFNPQGNQPSQAIPDAPARSNWLRGSSGLFVIAAGGYGLLYASWILFKWGFTEYETLIVGLGFLPLGIFAAICSFYASSRKNPDSEIRKAWRFIALGLILWAIADIISVSLELSLRGIDFPGTPDIFYIAGYAFIFMGLIAIPTELNAPSQQNTWVLDLLIITASTGSIVWYFIIAPTMHTGDENWLAQLVAGAYPVMDVILLSGIARILIRKSDVNTRQPIALLGFGFLTYIVADLAYAKLILLDLYTPGNWVDLFWIASYFIIGLAAIRQAYPYVRQSDKEQPRRLNSWASGLPLFSLALNILVSIYAIGFGAGTGLQTNGLLIGTGIAILFATIRQIITTRENNRLVEKLTVNSVELQTNANNLATLLQEHTDAVETQKQKINKIRLIGDISQGLASVKTLDDLLAISARTISSSLDLESTSIYLIDNEQEFITLASTFAKHAQPDSNRTLRVRTNDKGIISRVATSREPAQILNPQSSLMSTDIHILPTTRLYVALPLKVQNKVIGVLDLQHSQSELYDEGDIAITQILADQLAATIERIRLLEQVEKNLLDIEQAYGRFTREGWKTISETGLLNKAGYRFDNVRIQPITEVPELGNEAMLTGNIATASGKLSPTGKNLVALPIKLRGQTIGVVSATLKEGYSQNAITTLELAIERLAISLEAARLYEEARLRADREQMIAQVTTNISSAIDFDTILRTTVEEVGKSIGDAEISIQITGHTE